MSSPDLSSPVGTDEVVPVMALLGTLIGFAPSAVLRERLQRARALIPALENPPGIDRPGWAALIDELTVQETRLFRHPQLLEEVATDVLPALGREQGVPLRLVSAGCATGEEAFTLAMMAQDAGRPAEVLGLDISRPALEQARGAAWWPGPIDPLRDMPARFRTMLEPVEGRLRPVAAIRDMVRFHRANLVDPPPALLRGANLILCRNVLIYFRADARRRVLARLVDGLRVGGALVLGPTDTPPPELGLRPWRRGAIGIWCRA